MKKIVVSLLLISLVFLSGCRFFGGKKVRGNGNLVMQERSVGNFRGVRSSGSFDVVISSGPTQSVRIEAEDNLQEYIEAVVEGDIVFRSYVCKSSCFRSSDMSNDQVSLVELGIRSQFRHGTVRPASVENMDFHLNPFLLQ